MTFSTSNLLNLAIDNVLKVSEPEVHRCGELDKYQIKLKAPSASRELCIPDPEVIKLFHAQLN